VGRLRLHQRVRNLAQRARRKRKVSLVCADNRHLSRAHEDLPFTPDDLPGFATRVFDFAMAYPDLMRLIAWFSLEQKAEYPAERVTAREMKLQR
jgi:hypothetical protein